MATQTKADLCVRLHIRLGGGVGGGGKADETDVRCFNGFESL